LSGCACCSLASRAGVVVVHSSVWGQAVSGKLVPFTASFVGLLFRLWKFSQMALTVCFE